MSHGEDTDVEFELAGASPRTRVGLRTPDRIRLRECTQLDRPAIQYNTPTGKQSVAIYRGSGRSSDRITVTDRARQLRR